MFSNETYSLLFGLFRKIEPLLTIWYVYLYFFKLYPRMARASLIATTYQRDPSAVANITTQDVIVHAAIIQTIVHLFLKAGRNKKNE